MKTFKLHSLEILESKESNIDIVQHTIPLKDGLIINREDQQDLWVVEAYVQHDFLDFFKRLQCDRDEILIQVKITKESNRPAIFITSIISINEIGAHINVLFKGMIVNRQKSIVEDMLKSLIDQGYHGEELLDQFKALL